MRNMIGVIMICTGIIFGAYLGIWVGFVGGIIQIVNAFQMDPISGMEIGIGVLRIIFCELLFAVGFLLPFIIGSWLIDKSPRKSTHRSV